MFEIHRLLHHSADYCNTYKFGEEIIEKKDLKRKQKIPEMEKMKNRRQKNLKL